MEIVCKGEDRLVEEEEKRDDKVKEEREIKSHD